MVERHPLGSQAFIPMQGGAYLVLVAKAGETVDPSDLTAFIATGDQGVNYHAGTWHHPILALDKVSDFIVVDRGAGTATIVTRSILKIPIFGLIIKRLKV